LTDKFAFINIIVAKITEFLNVLAIGDDISCAIAAL
jgi:hypothetical protein